MILWGNLRDIPYFSSLFQLMSSPWLRIAVSRLCGNRECPHFPLVPQHARVLCPICGGATKVREPFQKGLFACSQGAEISQLPYNERGPFASLLLRERRV